MAISEILKLKPAKINDKRRVFEWLCFSETTKSHMGPPSFDDHPIPTWEEFCNDFEDYYFDGSNPKKGQLWIINIDDIEIGAICYSSFHLKGRSAELDIWMSTEVYCGKGLGSKAIMIFCDYLSKELGVDRFIIRPSKRNKRAVKAYEKAGFVKVSEQDKQDIVQQFLIEEYWETYGQGDYGNRDDIVLIKIKT